MPINIISRGTALAAVFAIALPASAQNASMSQQPVAMQRIEAMTQVNTEETRLARIEAQLKRLQAENEALKAQLRQLDERSQRFVSMPEGCHAGFSNGATVGTADGFHSKLFPFLTCR